MDARDADVAFLRRVEVWPTPEEEQEHFRYRCLTTVRAVKPPLQRIGRLQWRGWNSIHVREPAIAEALEGIAAALHCLERLMISSNGLSEHSVAAVAAVLATHPVEYLIIHGSGREEALVPPVMAWLSRPCARFLHWVTGRIGCEEDFAASLASSKALTDLSLTTFVQLQAAPLLLALQGHPTLQNVAILNAGDALDEDLCIRLAHMPSLRSCLLAGICNGHTRLELEDLPALTALDVSMCGVVDISTHGIE